MVAKLCGYRSIDAPH